MPTETRFMVDCTHDEPADGGPPGHGAAGDGASGKLVAGEDVVEEQD